MPSKQLTAVTRGSCTGFKPTPVPGVKLKDGTLASDDVAGLARWAEHFAAPLGVKQVDSVRASTFVRHEDEQMLQLCNTLDLSSEAVSKILRCMPKQRAVGPDGIASEIWIAGGDKLANLRGASLRMEPSLHNGKAEG